MVEPYRVPPVEHPIHGTIRPPGSKSITNRALVLAALANGTSHLTGVLNSADTQVMVQSLRRLGFEISGSPDQEPDTSLRMTGGGGSIPASSADLFLDNSGTSIRFLTALCALGHGRYRLDGIERMRERPIGDLVDALNAVGAEVVCEQGNDCPPVAVTAAGLSGNETCVSGTRSSQFLSALLMIAPACENGLRVRVDGELVSQPYVELTVRMMQSFGVHVDSQEAAWNVARQSYQATEYHIEPDASAASYFFAAAAVTGGRVTIPGLSRNALQGDVHFVDVLKQMGCSVEATADSITVTGPDQLNGVDVDMNGISDTAQTLAAIAPCASTPTTIRNIAHIRHKETDRLAALATELTRLGVKTDMLEDGLRIHPGSVQPAVVQTYNDHRMAMSFAVLGLRADGIRIADPGCTGKTYPRFFDDLRDLCAQ